MEEDDRSEGLDGWSTADPRDAHARAHTQPTRSQPTDKSKDVTCVEWSRDGERVLTGCYDGVARSVV